MNLAIDCHIGGQLILLVSLLSQLVLILPCRIMIVLGKVVRHLKFFFADAGIFPKELFKLTNIVVTTRATKFYSTELLDYI